MNKKQAVEQLRDRWLKLVRCSEYGTQEERRRYALAANELGWAIMIVERIEAEKEW